jgi:hypothetical protein
MKITKEHKERAYDMLDVVRDREDLAGYCQAIREEGNYKDLGKRVRWDVLWATDHVERREWFSSVYEYANDSHIDTVLREWARLNGLPV